MAKTRGYKSAVSAAIHEMATDFHNVGLIDKRAMSQFDESCLTPVPSYTPEQIRALRAREDVNQAVFAHYLGVSKDAVSQWERGNKRPSGPSLKLLSIVDKLGLAAIA